MLSAMEVSSRHFLEVDQQDQWLELALVLPTLRLVFSFSQTT